ncbi:hypothetical protein BGZ98_004255, partial [Dissophora globulifera]
MATIGFGDILGIRLMANVISAGVDQVDLSRLAKKSVDLYLWFSPIHSFMVDLQDKYIESLFSSQDWIEIKSNLPPSATYSTEQPRYLDILAGVIQEQDIISMDPSPFALDLSEDWWMRNAWNSTRLLAKAVPGSFSISGKVTGIDSASQRSNKERHVNITPVNNRKKMCVRADMIWRTVEAPVNDWMIGVAAKHWDENAG